VLLLEVPLGNQDVMILCIGRIYAADKKNHTSEALELLLMTKGASILHQVKRKVAAVIDSLNETGLHHDESATLVEKGGQ